MTKQPVPIRTDLFRFASIRTPQLICENKKQWGYIFLPDKSKSIFLKDIKTDDSIDSKRNKIQQVAKKFTGILTLDEIRKLYSKLYNFSCWLLRNRNSFTEQEIDEKIRDISELCDDELIDIWDNLFYELVRRKNHSHRQAYLQLIIANYFIANYKSPNIKKIAEDLIQSPKNPLPPSIEERFLIFLKRLAYSVLVIPNAFSIEKKDTDDKQNDDDQTDKTKLFGVNKLGIAVLRKVEQEVCCYVPGEVSRIENILAREYKERQTRSLISTETTEEETTETEVETQSDTVSTTRNELQTEISNVLTKDSSVETGASLGIETGVSGSGSFLGLAKGEVETNVSLDGYYDFASSTASTTSDSQAQTFAQEVTNTALERVLQKSSKKRTSRILEEYEETNRHGFDNRKGEQHVTGVYRWIDIIYTNRLINYGKRLMFEFLIPEPAKFYKVVLEKRISDSILPGEVLVKPEHPSKNGLDNPSEITGWDESKKHYYQKLAAKYDVELSPPPPKQILIKKTLFQSDLDNALLNSDDKTKFIKDLLINPVATLTDAVIDFFSKKGTDLEEMRFGFSYEIEIPTGYECIKATVYPVFFWDGEGSTDWFIQIGGKKILSVDVPKPEHGKPVIKHYDPKSINFLADPLINSIGISVSGGGFTYCFHVNVTLKCKLIDEEYDKWQDSTYNKIIDAYNAKLIEYETKAAEYAKKLESAYQQRSGNNKQFNRTVEQRELKRIAIEMLTKPFGLSMGDEFYSDPHQCKDGGTIPMVEQTKKWRKYSSQVKFFEQAFDWAQMSYLFYPYYWAAICDWAKLYQTEPAKDQIFEAFLQSGMARAVIPVRKGFEKAVNYYLETGDIWNGDGLVMDMDDDLYISIEEELREIEGFVEKEWPTRVPTTLTIVQGKSVYLADEGLPCCNKLEETGVDTLFRSSENTLTPQRVEEN